MSLRASIAALCTLFLLIPVASAQLAQNLVAPIITPTPGLHGKILKPDGKPASGIHVELDEASTALPVTSTYTEQDGTFALYNIPSGSYEVVAESKDALVADYVNLDAGADRVNLRLSRNAPLPEMLEPTVSVARMLVPERAQRLYQKAAADYKKGNLDKAKTHVEGALAIDPEFVDALTLRGIIEMNNFDLDAAQADFERAVRIDPDYSGAYIALGAIYNHQGRFDDAARVSQRSLTLSPKSWQAYFELAKATIAKGMYSKGLLLARQAQKLSGNSFASIHLIKAYALLPMRFYKDAKYELQAYLSHEPKGSSAQQAQTLLAQIEAASPPAPARH
jgi:tetratricopeptide (TPR) repeat protein